MWNKSSSSISFASGTQSRGEGTWFGRVGPLVPSRLTREVSGASPHPGPGESAPAGRAPRPGEAGTVGRCPEHPEKAGAARAGSAGGECAPRPTGHCASPGARDRAHTGLGTRAGDAPDEVLPKGPCPARAGGRGCWGSWRRKGLTLFQVIWVAGRSLASSWKSPVLGDHLGT